MQHTSPYKAIRWPNVFIGILGLVFLNNVVIAQETVRFNTQIRPLLSDRCFACHGPDEKQRAADLRLDQRHFAIAGDAGEAAIVPGRPAESLLLARIQSHDPAEVMPPPSAKRKPFTAVEVALLSRWIEQGAKYEDHWSFLPLARPAPPGVKQTDWPRTAVDPFLLAQLETLQIQPAPVADRAVLWRRVALDLTGLPPDPEKLAEYLADTAPDAYERWVDYLLQSPHHGERWGRHWLDQARYADSNGYSIDGEREMWPYRDWVIQALNRDLPFNQFTIEQLAGDLLPEPTKGQRVATGFHRNTLINQEGGSDREQFRVESVIDRVNTTGAVWLGLTIGCAQCHSHKFDPIAQREYYQLLAFFNSTEDANDRGPVVSVRRGELFGAEIPEPTDMEPSPAASKPAANTATPATAAAPVNASSLSRAEWELREKARLERILGAAAASEVEWIPAEPLTARTAAGVDLKILPDQSILAMGELAAKDSYLVTVKTATADKPLPRIAAVRLRVLTHESLPQEGPGRASNGNFVLSEFQLRKQGESLPWLHAFADHEQPKYPVAAAIDGDAATGWAINIAAGSNARLNANHEAVFVLREPLELPQLTKSGESVKSSDTGTAAQEKSPAIEVRLFHDVNAGYQVGRFALDLAIRAPRPPRGADDDALAALKVATDTRTMEQKKLLDALFQKQQALATKTAGNNPAKPAPKPNPGLANVMVMRELAQPRPTFLLTRGDFTRPDREQGAVNPDVPRAVSPALPPAESRRNRLTLAQWLVDTKNPLTPRVTVNRVWMRYFGRGLVETEEDFGMQGTPPTHPELLDWLAAEFLEQGWSLKQLHRQLVTSAVYRQSSRARPELRELDPRNLLLARQERLRLEGEVVRDAALSASGLLDRAVGGPSVRPPQPDGVYAFTQTAKNWTTATGGDRYRRGLYTFFFRSSPYPLLTTFDAPDFQTVCTRRVRSNTPLQSLTLANDPAFLEIARGLVRRLDQELPIDSSLSARIERAFLWTQSRLPVASEQQLLEQFAERQRVHFVANPSASELLMGDLRVLVGDAADKPRRQAELATLVGVARVLFNTDSFITRE